jgi:hypothetical protein
MQQEAVEIASHITHPVTVAAVGLVLAASALTIAMKAKRTRLAWLLAGILAVLACGCGICRGSSRRASWRGTRVGSVQWRCLATAGLPSPARVTGASGCGICRGSSRRVSWRGIRLGSMR